MTNTVLNLLNAIDFFTEYFFFFFTVTEKGFESESYSESEEDFQAPKAAQTAPFKAKPNPGSKEDDKKIQKKAPANSNKGGKQASIMGFFQKK